MSVVIALILLCASAAASEITYEFTGTVGHLAGTRDYYLQSVEVGDAVSGYFTLDTGKTNDISTKDNLAIYDRMDRMFALQIEGVDDVFTRKDGGATGRVDMSNNRITDGGRDTLDDIKIRSGLLKNRDGNADIDSLHFALIDDNSEMLDSLDPSQLMDLRLDLVPNQRNLLEIQEGQLRGTIFVDWLTLTPTIHNPGDANGDGFVDSNDLNTLALNWRQQAIWNGGDFTENGYVDAADLNELALNWQRPVTAVPEPTYWWTLLIMFIVRTRSWNP